MPLGDQFPMVLSNCSDCVKDYFFNSQEPIEKYFEERGGVVDRFTLHWGADVSMEISIDLALEGNRQALKDLLEDETGEAPCFLPKCFTFKVMPAFEKTHADTPTAASG